MNIKEARESVGLTKKAVSDWLGIPYRTLNSWDSGERECPAYVEKLIVEKILRDGKERNA